MKVKELYAITEKYYVYRTSISPDEETRQYCEAEVNGKRMFFEIFQRKEVYRDGRTIRTDRKIKKLDDFDPTNLPKDEEYTSLNYSHDQRQLEGKPLSVDLTKFNAKDLPEELQEIYKQEKAEKEKAENDR